MIPVSRLQPIVHSLSTSFKSKAPLVSVFTPEKARLEELKECLSSPSARASARQMFPADFEKVKKVCWEQSAARAAETTDRLAAQG